MGSRIKNKRGYFKKSPQNKQTNKQSNKNQTRKKGNGDIFVRYCDRLISYAKFGRRSLDSEA